MLRALFERTIMSTTQNDYSGPARAGWVLIFLTCGVSVIPVFGFASWLVAGPFLLVAFVLSIVVLARGGTVSGLLLLLFTVVIAPIFIFCAPFISTALGISKPGAPTTKLAAPNRPTPTVTETTRTAPSSATPVPAPRLATPAPFVPTPVARRFATIADAQQEAIRLYPSLGVAGSDFNRAFLARHKQYQQERPDFLRDPNWPITLAKEVASTLK